MDKDLFDIGEMEKLLSQISSSKVEAANTNTMDKMSKEMEASQRRYEQYIKKQNA